MGATFATLKEEFRDYFAPDVRYRYFEHAATESFQPQAEGYQLINAAWLADMALLAYVPTGQERNGASKKFDWHFLDSGGWKAMFVDDTLGRVGLSVRHFNENETQAFVAHDGAHVFVAFRGTEPVLKDLRTDLEAFPLKGEKTLGTVHKGFARALDHVWSPIRDHLDSVAGDTPVWFTGHSLGAALAVLAAGRWTAQDRKVGGLYTFGSPGVGDAGFTSAMATVPAFRFVNKEDAIAALNLAGRLHPIGVTRHVGADLQIGPPADPAATPVPSAFRTVFGILGNLLGGLGGGGLPSRIRDHSPRLYAEAMRAALTAGLRARRNAQRV